MRKVVTFSVATVAIAVVLLRDSGAPAPRDLTPLPLHNVPALTVEHLRNTPDAELVSFLEEHTFKVLDGDFETQHQRMLSLPAGLRMIFSTCILEGEVSNGGFNQFFWNSSGEYAVDAWNGFVLIGAKDEADLLLRAMELAKKEEVTRNRLKEQNTLQAFAESYKTTQLDDLDTKFYASAKTRDAAKVAFIRAHPEAFTHGTALLAP